MTLSLQIISKNFMKALLPFLGIALFPWEVKMNQETTNHYKNNVKVNNQLTLQFNLGNTLNLLALVTGIYILLKLLKRPSNKSQSL